MPDVHNVKYSQQTIDVITGSTYWIPVISIAILAILLIISMFIIANTIKLTVFARRKEINIMKYIGATDWFIRWPFVVEGISIGLIGALAAFILTTYGYNTIESSFSGWLTRMGITIIKVIDFKEIGFKIILLYAIVGTVVGTLGSMISLRRHLQV
jgi:cell division transport system permease protein